MLLLWLLLLLMGGETHAIDVLSVSDVVEHMDGQLHAKTRMLLHCNELTPAASPLNVKDIGNAGITTINVTCLSPKHVFDDVLIGYVPRAAYVLTVHQCFSDEQYANDTQAGEAMLTKYRDMVAAREAWEAAHGGPVTALSRRLLSLDRWEGEMRPLLHRKLLELEQQQGPPFRMQRRLLQATPPDNQHLKNIIGAGGTPPQGRIPLNLSSGHKRMPVPNTEFDGMSKITLVDLDDVSAYYKNIMIANDIRAISSALVGLSSGGFFAILGAGGSLAAGFFQNKADKELRDWMMGVSIAINGLATHAAAVDTWIGTQVKFNDFAMKRFHSIDSQIGLINNQVTSNYILAQKNSQEITNIANYTEQYVQYTTQRLRDVKAAMVATANFSTGQEEHLIAVINEIESAIHSLRNDLVKLNTKIHVNAIQEANTRRKLFERRAITQTYYALRNNTYPLEVLPFVMEDGIPPMPWAERLSRRTLSGSTTVAEVRLQFSTDTGAAYIPHDIKVRLKCDPEYFLNRTLPSGTTIFDIIQMLGPTSQNGTTACWDTFGDALPWTCHCVIQILEDTCLSGTVTYSPTAGIWPWAWTDPTAGDAHEHSMDLRSVEGAACTGSISEDLLPPGATEPFLESISFAAWVSTLCAGTYRGYPIATSATNEVGYNYWGSKIRIYGNPGNAFSPLKLNLTAYPSLCGTTMASLWDHTAHHESLLFNILQYWSMSYYVNRAMGLYDNETTWYGRMPSHVQYNVMPYARIPSIGKDATCVDAKLFMITPEKVPVHMLYPRHTEQRVLVEFNGGSVITNERASGAIPGTTQGQTNFTITNTLISTEKHRELLPSRGSYYVGGFPREGDATRYDTVAGRRIFDVPRSLMGNGPSGTSWGKVNYLMESVQWPGVNATSRFNLTQWMRDGNTQVNPDGMPVSASDFTRDSSGTYRTDLADNGVWDVRCTSYMDPNSLNVATPLATPAVSQDYDRCTMLRYYAVYNTLADPNTTVAAALEYDYVIELEVPRSQIILEEHTGCPTNYSVQPLPISNQVVVELHTNSHAIRTATVVESGCATSSQTASFSFSSPWIKTFTACGNDHDLQVYSNTAESQLNQGCFAGNGIPLNAEYVSPGLAGIRATAHEVTRYTSDRDVGGAVALAQALSRLEATMQGQRSLDNTGVAQELSAQLAADRIAVQQALNRFQPNDNRTKSIIDGLSRIVNESTAARAANAAHFQKFHDALLAEMQREMNISDVMRRLNNEGRNISSFLFASDSEWIAHSREYFNKMGQEDFGTDDLIGDLGKLLDSLPGLPGLSCRSWLPTFLCDIWDILKIIFFIFLAVAVLWLLYKAGFFTMLKDLCKKKKDRGRHNYSWKNQPSYQRRPRTAGEALPAADTQSEDSSLLADRDELAATELPFGADDY